MDVVVNIRQSTIIPARQKEAWEEFLDILLGRADAEIKNKKAESANSQLAGSAGRSV